jgi:type IV secretory pathway TrbD component
MGFGLAQKRYLLWISIGGSDIILGGAFEQETILNSLLQGSVVYGALLALQAVFGSCVAVHKAANKVLSIARQLVRQVETWDRC